MIGMGFPLSVIAIRESPSGFGIETLISLFAVLVVNGIATIEEALSFEVSVPLGFVTAPVSIVIVKSLLPQPSGLNPPTART